MSDIDSDIDYFGDSDDDENNTPSNIDMIISRILKNEQRYLCVPKIPMVCLHTVCKSIKYNIKKYKINSILLEIMIYNNNIDSQLLEILRAILHSRTLHVVKLTCCNICKNTKYIFKMLKYNKSVIKLHLRGNLISGVPKDCLRVLANHPFLQVLDLSHNKIDSVSKDIFKVLGKNTVIHTLNLSYNCIGEHIKWIKFLKNNKSLKNLSLSGNNLGNNTKYVFKMLKQNRSISSLAINNNVDIIYSILKYIVRSDLSTLIMCATIDPIKLMYNRSLLCYDNSHYCDNKKDGISILCKRNYHNMCQKAITLQSLL